MTTTLRPNRDALSRAIDIYRDAMRPFILRSLKRMPGVSVETAIRQSLPDRQADNFRAALGSGEDLESALDVNIFPPLVSNFRNWREVFSTEFGGDQTVQNELWMIKDARNEVSHPGTQDLEGEYTRTHLYLIADVLGRINAPQLKQAVEDIRDQLITPAPAAEPVQAVQETGPSPQEQNAQPRTRQQSRSTGSLKPWREVIRPNQDVAQGSYQQAEFAADLQQVYDGRADTTQYGNPVSFFDHTYITPGIRALLVNTLKRLNGTGGDPVIQTKTGFGGGKTHSLIALYHLVRNAGALISRQAGDGSRTSDEIRSIMEEAGYDQNPDGLGEVAVLDGAYLSPTDATPTLSGDPLNTLWGVMAYQLGGLQGYDIVGEAARQGTAPGGAQLDALFEHVGPCVILMDEPVAYVRNAGAAQDSIYTFIQALTQSVRRSKDVALVITLPQSRVEAGGEGGAEAMDRIESILGRIEAVWEPLAINETFEVVRRRLFGPVTDPDARNRTCEAFSNMYSRSRRDYPQGVAEQNYQERIRACYPIHPEIFDRLYSDWSSIPEFQRTRGVLRMMAKCVNRLYLSNDPNPLIMPADLPLSDETLANEFIRLLPGEWRPVITEVDSDNSRTDNIDQESQRFADVGGAARRIARTVFLGSAGSGAIRGVDSRQIHLGTVQPGQGVTAYTEALSRMTGNLYYLYNNGDRYFFYSEENLNKVANDRADALDNRTIDAYIIDKLEEASYRQSDVVIYAHDTGEIRDDAFVRLVVLPPALSLPSRSSENDDASPEALKILNQRGDAPRVRRNTLLFLAARRDEVRNLRNAVRRYLAWHSIVNGETRIQNLTGDRLGQARSAVNNADREVRNELVRAYRWALAPFQRDPQRAEYELNQSQTSAPDFGEIFKSAFDKFVQDEALVNLISTTSLTSMLQQYIWNREDSSDHLSVDALWDLMTSNVYMHRLKDRTVLESCIEDGVEGGAFGYAAGYDGERYEGLRYSEPLADSSGFAGERNRRPGFLVRPDAAARQKEADAIPTPPEILDRPDVPRPDTPPPPDLPPPPGPRLSRRIVARKTTGANISLDDVNVLREEIIRNLTNDGGEVTVEIIVSATKAEGFSESIARSVRENSTQLGLEFSEGE